MKTGKKCVSFSCFVAKTPYCSLVLITESVKGEKKKIIPSSYSCAAYIFKGQEGNHQCGK